MNRIRDTNLQELCRACLRTLKENDQSASENINGGDKEISNLKSLLLPNLCKLFMFLTTYDVNNEYDDFPKRLCALCYGRLMDYDEFRKLAVKSTEILHQKWNAIQMNQIIIAKESELKTEFLSQIKHEFNDDPDDDNQLLLPELANMPINIKPEPIFETMETQFILPSFSEVALNKNQIRSDADSVDDHDNGDGVSDKLFLPNSNNCSSSYISSNSVVSNTLVPQVKRGIDIKNLHCNDCNKQFYKEVYLEDHIRATHINQKKPFECSICTKAFTRYNLLSDHVNSRHNEELTSPNRQKEKHTENTSESNHICSICRRKYSSKRALREHIKRHKKIKEHVCQECGVAKVTRTELLTHMRTHTPNLQKFSCPQCPQVFNHKNAISRHVKVVHEGLRRFPCTYCPKRFGTRNSQVCHERLHTGERPFICEICQKGFVQQEGLKSHMKNHDKNLRKHICRYCSRRFITLKNLKDHERRHTSDKPHICNICSKGFYKYDDLRIHRFSHFEIGDDGADQNDDTHETII